MAMPTDQQRIVLRFIVNAMLGEAGKGRPLVTIPASELDTLILNFTEELHAIRTQMRTRSQVPAQAFGTTNPASPTGEAGNQSPV